MTRHATTPRLESGWWICEVYEGERWLAKLSAMTLEELVALAAEWVEGRR